MLLKGMFKKPNISLEGEEHVHSTRQPGEVVRACSACKASLFVDELARDYYVCKACGQHFRLDARTRINLLTDENTFEELDAAFTSYDRLEFREYQEKLNTALRDSGENEAVITGTCCFGGLHSAIFAMNPSFMMGSMGTVVGEKVTRLFEYAAAHALPVVGFTVSGGARVQEGIFSLMQMAKTSGAVLRHHEAGLFYLTILTDPTTGGVTASFAMEGDIILAEPKALIGFAGPRVIEQTMRQTLPQGFQRAEMLLGKGFIDSIVDRREQRATIIRLLKIHEGGEQACLRMNA